MSHPLIAIAIFFPVAVASPLWSQSITADGNIETDAQLVSKAATGAAPLAVSSTTMVPNLNADQVDGLDSTDLALESDLQTVEEVLDALSAQVDALGLALVPRTGQTTCYDAAGAVIDCATDIGPGQDGDLQLGVTWPNPRFADNGNGTVTDNLTGLTWLENANCAAAWMNWASALAFANTLFDGSTDHNGGDCGLTDGSAEGAWRLPNLRELLSLVHYGVNDPAVPDTSGTGQWSPGTPFTSVLSNTYWSATTSASSTATAWYVTLSSGTVGPGNKILNAYVWPVRGGQ